MKKLILLTVLFYFGSKITYAQPGTLDPSFGNNGIVRTDMGSPYNYSTEGKKVFVQPDGSIYIVIVKNGIVVTKKHADGTTDLTYGDNGLSVPVAISFKDAALQTDGKIVVVGSSSNKGNYNTSDFVVVRFNTDGSLDKTFSGDGIQVKDLGYAEQFTSVVIQNDGKIVLAGYEADTYGYPFFYLTRYNTDGTLDGTFNGYFEFCDTCNVSQKIILQSDGKIIVARSNGISRYNTNGSLDISFQPNGFLVFSMAIQDNGKIIVAGGNAFARYNTDGSLDNTFDVDGKQTAAFQISSVVTQTDGKITVAGGSDNDFSLARFNANGSLDNTFDGDGMQTTDFGSSADYANSLAIQSDGKLVALGYSVNGPNSYVAVARYNTNGSLDNSFDGGGKLVDPVVSQGYTFYTSTTIQNDGKILVAGNSWNGSDYDFALVRYNPDGSFDNTFSGDGKQLTDFGSSNDYANSIAIQRDGKILVAGSSNGNFALARYNTDGSLDNMFDGDGIQTTDFGSSDYISKIVVQSDGKILAGGSTLTRYNTDGSRDMNFNGNFPTCTDIAIQNDGKLVVIMYKPDYELWIGRYNNDGSSDETFGYGGIAVISGELPDDVAVLIGKSVAIQNDGKIIIGGYREIKDRGGISFSELALTRLNIDGFADGTFNGGEVVYTRLGYSPLYDYATSVKIQNDNKIILAGYSFNNTSNDFALARYNTNGSLDNTFSNDGLVLTQVSTADDRIAAIAIAGNRLYAAGFGQFPGNFGVVAKYFLDDESPVFPTVNITHPVDSASYLSPVKNLIITAAASDSDGTISKVGFYNGDMLLGTATAAPYSFAWQNISAGNYTLTAKATDNDGNVTTSVPVHISVAHNTSPTVSISNPVNNRIYLRPANIYLEAMANDVDGNVTKVEFYNGTKLLQTSRVIPYHHLWTNVDTGHYVITARATDNWGAVTVSDPIYISVVHNQPPTVSTINPVNEQNFTAPANIRLEAAATDADGRITKVEFYNGTTLLQTSRVVPYHHLWENVAAGTYTVTAIATDNWGAKTTSHPVTITVTSTAVTMARSQPQGNSNAAINNIITLKLAPNPVNNMLNIYTSGLQKKQTSISIISSSGVITRTMQISNLSQTIKLNVASLASGVYTVKMVSVDKVMYKQFVKL